MSEMTEIVLTIDGQEIKATAGMTVLQAAQKAGIYIPTLCHHEKLEAFGGCRLCMVEVEARGWTSYVVSCVYPVAKDIVVRTRSAKVDKIRKVLVEELMAHAPDAPELIRLAEEYGADRNRFERDASFCIVCGLCVRYCNEVKQKNAVGFIDNGARREISFIPEVAKDECWDCQECFTICPTSYAQAAYLLTEALAFPGQRKVPIKTTQAPEPTRRVIPIMPVAATT
ncbi:MAG: 2Fe-2S iron-sulfur cluster-binding protein [Sulfuritalea sp.]|jgi:NADH dehydrogenase/NADH:ubiquinone oxidoreductase subunit G|nr:2Fe-2S iron-sulfur cluster-binding protein [Sulfuritalea sp.]